MQLTAQRPCVHGAGNCVLCSWTQGMPAIDLYFDPKPELMAKILTEHETNGANRRLRITADAPDHKNGGASHIYTVSTPVWAMQVAFQRGPIGEVGVNGVTHEALLAIMMDRLRSFQSGPHGHTSNQVALEHLEAALAAMKQRTAERTARGVEGTHEV